MAKIVATSTGFPENFYEQKTLIDGFSKYWAKRFFNSERIRKFHERVLVSGRHLALPMERYEKLSGLQECNDAYLEVATKIATEITREALHKVDLEASEINQITSTTVTGIAVPSLDARLMNTLHFGDNVVRMPLFGLGCLGGAAGLARVADYLRGQKNHVSLLIAIELCSLTLQREDFSIANIISSGLFGDGGGAVIVVGEDHPLAKNEGFEIVANRSYFFRDTERLMGWDVIDSGFQVVLSPDVPLIAKSKLPGAVDELLFLYEIDRSKIKAWIAHPGGPKVISGIIEGLEIDESELAITRDSLAKVGNVSSASVLFILDETIRSKQFAIGDYALLFAMGPGFSAELVLLRWQ